MKLKAFALIIGFYYLAGSVLLPLGDYSLMKDLPQMYRSYQKLTSKSEQGFVDFIGDYLMGGKIIFGHNKHDAPETAKTNVQFQHATGFCSIINLHFHQTTTIIAEIVVVHPDMAIPFYRSGFHKELFRPPLPALG